MISAVVQLHARSRNLEEWYRAVNCDVKYGSHTKLTFVNSQCKKIREKKKKTGHLNCNMNLACRLTGDKNIIQIRQDRVLILL